MEIFCFSWSRRILKYLRRVRNIFFSQKCLESYQVCLGGKTGDNKNRHCPSFWSLTVSVTYCFQSCSWDFPGGSEAGMKQLLMTPCSKAIYWTAFANAHLVGGRGSSFRKGCPKFMQLTVASEGLCVCAVIKSKNLACKTNTASRPHR